MFTVNVWAILVSGVASMAIGAFWYSPKGFGKMWMRLQSINPDDCKPEQMKGMAKAYILTFISTLIIATGLNALISGFAIVGALNGALLGAIAWFAFSLTTSLPAFFFNIKKPPVTVFFIEVGQLFVAWVVSGAILAVW